MVLAKLEALVVRVWDLMLLASVQGRARALGFEVSCFRLGQNNWGLYGFRIWGLISLASAKP